MLRFKNFICFFLILLSACTQINKSSKKENSNNSLQFSNKRILFVVTSQNQIPKTGDPTGAYISEITHPYKILSKAGYKIDFVSPKGGETPLDGMDELDEISQKLLTDNDFLKKLQLTKSPTSINPKKYSAIFYAGGHGTMFDLPKNKELQNLTAEIYERGGLVAAVCHGPAGLINVKLSNGQYLVDGKEVSSFTNEEEKAVKLTDAMPFLLEDELKKRGAVHTKSDKFKEHVVVSGRLITGQNPKSADGVGRAILKNLKRLKSN